MDSTRVMLKTLNGQDMQKFTGYIIDEKFELCGKLNVPTHCRLNLDNYDYIKSIGGDLESSRTCNIDLFVENGELAFTTPHLDSLPQAFWRYDIRKEKNYKLEGSPAQDAYYRYQQQTIPLRYDLYTPGKREPHIGGKPANQCNDGTTLRNRQGIYPEQFQSGGKSLCGGVFEEIPFYVRPGLS